MQPLRLQISCTSVDSNLPAVRHSCRLSRKSFRDPIGFANPRPSSQCLDNAFILYLDLQKPDLPTLVRPRAGVSVISTNA